MSEPTVFIIDDDPSARRGLTRLVRAAGLNAESFASGTDFLASEHHTGPGCIVLDVQMPEMTGPELQEELAKADYSMPIVFLSAHADVPIAAGAMKRGAVDFLTKPVDGKDLLAAIEESLARDAENREQRAETLSIQELIETLTPREHEVMTYVITGMLNKQIAAALEISEETVKIHRARVMNKLEIVSVAELVRLCERAGIEPAETSGQGPVASSQ
jgi:RNA polymerase sigma factor (sigma-70 family)